MKKTFWGKISNYKCLNNLLKKNIFYQVVILKSVTAYLSPEDFSPLYTLIEQKLWKVMISTYEFFFRFNLQRIKILNCWSILHEIILTNYLAFEPELDLWPLITFGDLQTEIFGVKYVIVIYNHIHYSRFFVLGDLDWPCNDF